MSGARSLPLAPNLSNTTKSKFKQTNNTPLKTDSLKKAEVFLAILKSVSSKLNSPEKGKANTVYARYGIIGSSISVFKTLIYKNNKTKQSNDAINENPIKAFSNRAFNLKRPF